MQTKNLLNISFFIVLVFLSTGISSLEKNRRPSSDSHMVSMHSKKSPSFIQFKAVSEIKSLDDLLSVNVHNYQGRCSELFQLQAKLSGYLNQLSNYSIGSMDQDLERLQTAKSLVADVLRSLSGNTPSLIQMQMTTTSQLQETMSMIGKLRSLNLIKSDSFESIKSKVSQLMTSSSLEGQTEQANDLLSSINGIISQVSSVRHQLFSVHEVNALEKKHSTLNTMISTACTTSTGSEIIKNVTQTSDLPSYASDRAYIADDAEPFFLEIDGDQSVNLTATTLTEYVVGGWVRWLDFIDGTYDHSHDKDEAVIARLFSQNRTLLGDNKYYEDRHVYITRDASSYTFCLHDTSIATLDNCQVFDVSAYPREDVWDFVMVMYSYTTGAAVARVKVGGETWISQAWDKPIEQVAFTGYLGAFIGGDDFYDQRTSFNGELTSWRVWYGTNTFWGSQADAFLDSNAESILETQFPSYDEVPAVSSTVEVNSDEVSLSSSQYSLYSFYNTFIEATTYGFGLWTKVSTPGQIATLSFDLNNGIDTPGNAIAQVYVNDDNTVWVDIAYEDDRAPAAQSQQVAVLPDGYFLIQVQFSENSVTVYVESNGDVSSAKFTQFDHVYVPQNVFLTVGAFDLLGKQGATLSYKTTTVYAGDVQLYGKTCDASCATCSGTTATDCTSCFDGFFVESGSCKACDDSCLTCDGCGKDHCTTCPDGKVLANGQCYCDPSCLTCNGITDSSCTSCDEHQVLVGGQCKECHTSCLECSDTTSSGCTACDDGYKISNGQCVPLCDTDLCQTCTSDGSQCASCYDGQALSNGTCVACHSSCKTCSGPEEFQCLDCESPAQFSCGKCIVCDDACLTCDGPTSSDCLTCSSDKELVGKECLVPCDEDAGYVRVDDECLACDSSCKTCSGTQSDECTSCADDLVLSKGSCIPINPQPCDTTNGYVMINNECIYCDIDNGYALINENCIKCDASCKSCYGTEPNNCIDCYDPLILSNGKCGEENPQCNPEDGEVLVDNECVPCDSSCVQCSGTTAQDCTVCDSDHTLVDGECITPPAPCDTDNGYVYVGTECVPCDETCLTCSGPSSTECIECADGLEMDKDTGKCGVACDVDNGNVMINGVCYPCDKTCQTCSGLSATDCITCVEGLNYDSGSCLPPCDTDNGYVLIDAVCLPCHESCATCSDVSNKDCTSCTDPLVLQAGACVEPPVDCDPEDGLVWVNENCVPCDQSCKTCNDVSDSSCLTCEDGYTLVSGKCVVVPPECEVAGKIFINGECFDCDASCYNCSGVSDTDCIYCAEGKVMEDGKCVDFCDTANGFFKQNGQCLPCDSSCKTCDGTDNDNCVTCPDGDFYESGKCLPEECVNKDYMPTDGESKDGACSTDCDCEGTRRCGLDGLCDDCNHLNELNPEVFNTDLCPPCDSTCLYCDGPAATDCTDCQDGYYLTSEGACQVCDATCVNCDGPSSSECTECGKDDVLIDGVCHVPCDTENGYFYSDPRTCVACGRNCQTCDGSENTDCQTCVSGTELTSDGECLPPCDTTDGYFYDANGQCQACDDSCQECNGAAENQCTVCPDNYFLEFGKCYPSKCVNYEYVFDESIITECNSDCECDGTRRCSPDGQCEDCNVLVTLYPDIFTNAVCPPCSSECETCRGPSSTDCTTCQPGYYYESGQCLPCDSSCATCSGAGVDQCVTCDSTHVLRDGKCVEPCDESNGYFYDKDDVCTPCDDTCKTCSDTTNDSCLSCYGTDTLEDNICWPECDTNAGYTYDENHKCVPCDSSCLTCSGTGSDQCTTCVSEFNIVDGRCVSCVSYYYVYDETSNVNGVSHCSSDCECDNTRRCAPNGVCEDCVWLATYFPTYFDAKDCPACDESCLTCSGPSANECTNCNSGYYLGTDDACYPCDSSCEKCDGPTDSECTTCPTGYLLSEGKCVEPPVECDSSCLECSGTTDKDCTACSEHHDLVDGQCIAIDCVSWDYEFDETADSSKCQDDCECDNSRRCGPSGYCGECLDLVQLYPDVYDLNDCPVCDDSCNTCSGASDHDCTSCASGYYLTSSGSCSPCDSSCALCDGGSSSDCTACPPERELESKQCVIPCDSSCETCSGTSAQNCTSCSIDKVLVGGECITIPVCVKNEYQHDETGNALGPSKCINDCDCDASRRCSPDGVCFECMYLANLYPTLYDSSDCPDCDTSCLTCQGVTASDCTACQDGYALVSGQCLPCDKSCLTCDEVDDSSCLSCDTGFVLSEGKCVEPPVTCDSSCLECSGSAASDCTKCADGSELQDGYCVPIDCISWDYKAEEVDGRCNTDCDCDNSRRCSPDKYCMECDILAQEFPSIYSPSDCPVCDSSCDTCDGATSTDCTSCSAGEVLTDGSCEPCDESCATCDGITANDCTTCHDGYELESTESGDTCVVPSPPCDSSCYTCSGTGPNDCTSCASGYQLAFDGSCQEIKTCVKWGYSVDESKNALGPSRCSDDCDCDNTRRCSSSGYCMACEDLAAAYPDVYSLKDCPVCDDSCLTCDGATAEDCTACPDGSFFNDGVCETCAVENCLVCTGDANTCGQCDTDYLLDSGSCVVPPVECDKSCLECFGPDANQCSKCGDGYYLEDSECIPVECVSNDYVFDEETAPLGAHRCNNDCECDGSRRCSPDKYCGECVDLVFSYPTVYSYSDCPYCDASCLSCSGPSSKECTSCDTGFVLVSGECLACDSSCATCQDTTTTGCLTCPSGYDLQTDGTCQPHIDCDVTCLTCSGSSADQCTSCDTERELVEGRCELTCVQFTYLYGEASDGSCKDDCECDGTRRCGPSGTCDECAYLLETFPSLYATSDCPECDSSCKTCYGSNPDNCKSCEDGYYLASDSTCQACDKNCQTCDGGNEDDCLSCYDPYVLQNGYCINHNDECDDSCATCYGPGQYQCVTCNDNYVLSDDGSCVLEDCISFDYLVNELLNKDGPNTCSSDCDCDGTRRCGPDGFCHECSDLAVQYPTIYSSTDCPSCDSSCLTCDGSTEKDCLTCNDGYVLVEGECLPCDSSCLTCSGVENNNCLTCPTGTVLTIAFTCSVPYPICDNTCQTCVGPNSNECSSCYGNLTLVDGECKDPVDCNTWSYVHDELTNTNGAYSCSSDCDCAGTRRCSPDGYCHECVVLAEQYPDQYTCEACDASCYTCDGPTAADCLTCLDGYYLDKDGCLPCDSTCLTCSGGDPNNCVTCSSERTLEDGYCVIPDPKCDATCLTCTGPNPTDCTSCGDGYSLSTDGTCEPVNCISFDWSHNETLNVDGCDSDCDCDGSRRCGPSGYCESCLELSNKYPTNYPASMCPACDESCDDCDGPNDDNCIACPDGFYLFNGQCIDCDDSCDTCFGTSYDNCLSCPTDKVLWKSQCWTPDPQCDSTCVTCSGSSAYECLSCPCDTDLVEGQCIPRVITCDSSCVTCIGTAANQCTSCSAGMLLIQGECVTISSFVGMRRFDESPLKYEVNKKISEKSDVAVGTWTRFLTYVPTKVEGSEPYNVLFRLSGLTSNDKELGTNDYRFSSLAVYYNFTHYTFETYSKASGVPVLIQKSVPINEFQLENSWNLIFFGYSRTNNKATGYVVFPDGAQSTVEFTEVVQDKPEENMEVFFFGDEVYKGFNGEVSSPEVLHGNNFLQTFDLKNKNTYFPFKGSNSKATVSLISVKPNQKLGETFSGMTQYSVGGWIKVKPGSTLLNLFGVYFTEDTSDNVVEAKYDPSTGSVSLSLDNIGDTTAVNFVNKEGASNNQYIFAFVSYDAEKHRATFAAKLNKKEFFKTFDNVSSFIPGSNVQLVVGEGESAIGNVFMESGRSYENIEEILEVYKIKKD